MMLLITSMVFCEDYRIIQKSEDGRYYLDENTVILLANYIKKLEDMNMNYQAQIGNLEEQVANLKDLISAYEEEINKLSQDNKSLKDQIDSLSWQRTTLGVIAAISIGAVIILFLR